MGEPGLCSRCKGVDADQPIACTTLKGSPCSACEERAAIQGQIKQLEEKIANLKAKHHALGSRMNAIHDPFIHKLPVEISSHIFRLCLPTLDYEGPDPWFEQWEWVEALRLGAVCRKWRQVAWATPDLWDTLCLTIEPSMKCALAQSLPGLLREWLSRSGMLPLNILFRHFGCSEREYYNAPSDKSTIQALDLATDSVIEIINVHSGRWRNLYLEVAGDIPERLCGSIELNQLFGLELVIDGERSPTQKFIMKSKPFPTRLTLINFLPTSIDIGWDNITHATLRNLNASDCLEALERAPALAYCLVEPLDDTTVNFDTITLHPQLRSLNFLSQGTKFLEAINVPSLEEWIHNVDGGPLPVTAMVSLLKRSGCCLKILNLQHISAPFDDLPILFQAVPSLEHLRIHFCSDHHSDRVMDDILARIFNSPTDNSAIPSETARRESFLPRLQFMEYVSISRYAPFSWDYIPQLYRQGHRRSLALKSAAKASHITHETALQLLKLADEGVDLQIHDQTTRGGGDFLENFRKKVCNLSTTNSSKQE